MNDNTKGIFFASITTFLWGILAIGQKVMLDYADPFTIVGSRFFVAFSILLIYFLLYNRKELVSLKKPPFLIIIAGIALGINYIGCLKGLEYTTPGNVQILMQTSPLILLVVSFLFFKENISRTQLVGIIIVVLGLVIFYNDQLQAFANNKDAYNIGILFVMMAAIAWVFYAIIQKVLVKKYHPQLLNMIMYLVPLLGVLPFVDFTVFAKLNLWQTILLIALGLNTLVAYGSLSVAFKYTQANKVSLIITIAPVITVVCMSIISIMEVTWIEHEILSLESSIGAAIIVLGVMTTKFSIKSKKLSKLFIRKNR